MKKGQVYTVVDIDINGKASYGWIDPEKLYLAKNETIIELRKEIIKLNQEVVSLKKLIASIQKATEATFEIVADEMAKDKFL